jgi:hypothetical protein
MIIERQRNLAAAAGCDEHAQPGTPTAFATSADGPAFNRMPSLLKQPLPQRGLRFPAAAAAATESRSALLNAAAAAAAARRNADDANLAAAGAALSSQWNSDGRLSGSFRHSSVAPLRSSFELDVYGGYTSALAFPAAFDQADGVLRVLDDDNALADGVEAAEGGLRPGRQMQQQSSFQDNLSWFV